MIKNQIHKFNNIHLLLLIYSNFIFIEAISKSANYSYKLSKLISSLLKLSLFDSNNILSGLSNVIPSK